MASRLDMVNTSSSGLAAELKGESKEGGLGTEAVSGCQHLGNKWLGLQHAELFASYFGRVVPIMLTSVAEFITLRVYRVQQQSVPSTAIISLTGHKSVKVKTFAFEQLAAELLLYVSAVQAGSSQLWRCFLFQCFDTLCSNIRG